MLPASNKHIKNKNSDFKSSIYERSLSCYINRNGQPVEYVKVFKYLGCIIKYDEPLTGDTELQMKIDTTTWKFYE